MKYQYNWRDSMRFRQGMLWKGETPSFSDYPQGKTYAIRLLIVFLLWGLVMQMDYAEEQRQIAEHSHKEEVKRTKDLADCMNGEAIFENETKTEATVCRSAYSFKI